MTSTRPARATTGAIRMPRRRAAGALVAIVAIVAALGSEPLLSRSLRASPPSPSSASAPGTAPPRIDRPRGERRDARDEAGGAVPDGTTVLDDDVPAVARLDPALLRALRQATTDARADGVGLVVSGGWRSPAYEDRLRREAIAKYGSEAEAARWVATGATSAHVTGDAVDVGPAEAMAWLSAHGAGYGLCRIYGNEPWHFELRPAAIAHGCPSMYADPTQDPRMRR